MTLIGPHLCAAALLISSYVDAADVEMSYVGTLTPTGRNANSDAPVKRFELYSFLTGFGSDSATLFFLVDEFGGDAWPWPERFGQMQLNTKNEVVSGRSKIRILHTHAETPYPLELRRPLFEFAERLRAGAQWQVNDDNYEVVADKVVGDFDCWQVRIESKLGRRQMLWVDKENSVVVAAERRLFMGRGDEFLLRMELDTILPVDADRTAAIQKPIATLIELQTEMKRRPDEIRPELNSDQLGIVSGVIDDLQQESVSTRINRLASVIARDIKAQSRRTDNVATLAQRFVGQNLPDFDLKTIDGRSIKRTDLSGHISVLHFWEYLGEPLAEPYGQVGYLEFLKTKRQRHNVQIIGIAVNSLTEDPQQSAQALKSARQLSKFMNLSYPIATDNGSVIRKFGDPRKVGAKLPLWVVVAPDLTIADFRVGYYDIDPNRGLYELDDTVVDLIQSQPSQNSGAK